MKIKLDIDCSPEELRGFFGLPDIRGLQEQLLKEVEAQMRAGIKAIDPEAMLKPGCRPGCRALRNCRRCSWARWVAARARSSPDGGAYRRDASDGRHYQTRFNRRPAGNSADRSC